MKTYSFESLNVWQCARKLANFIYTLTASFPPEEKFGMVSQMRRAAISVCSNLAEGSSKHSGKEKAKYSGNSYCSLMELLNQSIVGVDLLYIRSEDLTTLRSLVDEIAVKTSRLRESQLKEYQQSKIKPKRH
ncbi:MAG TPA: four helix bundle protein [Saprospiraceae bacterium]|nr:four helix bundle protein [Saprospiraceae bacterium]